MPCAAVSPYPYVACRGCERLTEALEGYDRAAELARRGSGAAFSSSDIQVHFAFVSTHPGGPQSSHLVVKHPLRLAR